MPQLETLILEQREGVAILTLNRPERLNAMNKQMLEELVSCLEQVRTDPRVKCLVVKGAGRAFCSGADIISITREIDLSNPLVVREYLKKASRVVSMIYEMEKPVIAQVQGVVAGAGCNLALSADLVVAAENAVLSQVFVKRGIVPDFGGLYLVPRLVGLARAKELLLFGDDICAGEAVKIGLINRAVPSDELDATVAALASRFVNSAPEAIALTKTGINVGLRGDLDAVLEYEAAAQGLVFQTDFLKNALRAFAEKRGTA